ncbi:MAG: LytR C-terminal domain-containing protein [Candidatus Eisenbacteria bacterium]|nr:LytR C-terminal domain-containing protein [Candidatus Eisenbacteria bacterium]
MSRKRDRRRGGGRGASFTYTIGAVVLIGAVAFFALTYYGLFESSASRDVPTTVLVLNGCGVEGLGLRAAKLLRSHGFDVVDYRNADRPDYAQSIVIDRAGDTGVARHVARLIGTGGVIQQIPDTPLVDVVLIVGADHARYLGTSSGGS